MLITKKYNKTQFDLVIILLEFYKNYYWKGENMMGKIIVVSHKEYDMPNNNLYLPIFVGSSKENVRNKYQTDDTGNNISKKNNIYCELTALYWEWKNLNYDFLGISHYRRYFSIKRKPNGYEDILNEEQINQIFMNYDVIVVKPRRYLTSVRRHYINCIKTRKKNHILHLELLKEVLNDIFPKYSHSFDLVMSKHSSHMLNMFIMKKNDFNSYCGWLFSILFELEKRIEKANVMYDRIMGALSEFLLDVWLITNNKKVYEAYLYELEKNYLKKVKRVLKRKLFE